MGTSFDDGNSSIFDTALSLVTKLAAAAVKTVGFSNSVSPAVSVQREACRIEESVVSTPPFGKDDSDSSTTAGTTSGVADAAVVCSRIGDDTSILG